MEGEKAEANLSGMPVPSAAQQCNSIAIQEPSLWPQLHLLRMVDRVTGIILSLILKALPREEKASRG